MADQKQTITKQSEIDMSSGVDLRFPIQASFAMKDMSFFIVEEADFENLETASKRYEYALATSWACGMAGIAWLLEPVFMGLDFSNIPPFALLVSFVASPVLFAFAYRYYRVAVSEKKAKTDVRKRIEEGTKTSLTITFAARPNGSSD